MHEKTDGWGFMVAEKILELLVRITARSHGLTKFITYPWADFKNILYSISGWGNKYANKHDT